MKRQYFAAMLTAGLGLPALATTTSVATVADLISAVQNAKNNDEIVVMAAGSPYMFTAEQQDVVAHLYARVKIKLRGETGNPADVVLVGNANRILYLTYNDNSIRDLTFRNGDSTGYSIRSSEEPYDQLRGGAICLKSDNDATTVISNCVFQSCKSKNGGGACGTYSVSKAGGNYYDCIFDGNATSPVDVNTTLAIGGGALYRAKFVKDSTFMNNYSSTLNGGALYGVPDVWACSIVSNSTSSIKGFGGGLYDCTLTGCHVASNYAYRCGAAADSRFYSCTNRANKSQGDYLEFGLTAGGPGCYAEDCTFIDVGKSGNKTFGTSVFNRCRFDGNSFVSGSHVFSQTFSMTNCLISGTSGVRFFQALNAGCEMVNCTVVSNTYYFTGNDASYSPCLTIKNSFFYGNNCRNDISTAADIPAVATNLVSSFQNCILSAKTDQYVPGSGNYNYYPERATFNPGFVGLENDPENPFAIARKSPACKKAGIVEDWMASATDLRGDGFPRLRAEKVNIGCYQYWGEIPGMTIIIR
jgi:predicted outer membrane repeat protein